MQIIFYMEKILIFVKELSMLDLKFYMQLIAKYITKQALQLRKQIHFYQYIMLPEIDYIFQRSYAATGFIYFSFFFGQSFGGRIFFLAFIFIFADKCNLDFFCHSFGRLRDLYFDFGDRPFNLGLSGFDQHGAFSDRYLPQMAAGHFNFYHPGGCYGNGSYQKFTGDCVLADVGFIVFNRGFFFICFIKILAIFP